MANEVILTQDISSGRVHKRYRMPGGNLASFEGCNLDDAGDYWVLDSDTGRMPSGHSIATADLCRNCFPEDDGSTAPESA